VLIEPVVAVIDDANTEDTLRVLVVVIMSTKVLFTMLLAMIEDTMIDEPTMVLKLPLSKDTLVPEKVDTVRDEMEPELAVSPDVTIVFVLIVEPTMVLYSTLCADMSTVRMDDPVSVLYSTLCADTSVVRMELPVNVLYSTVCADKSVVRMEEPVKVLYPTV